MTMNRRDNTGRPEKSDPAAKFDAIIIQHPLPTDNDLMFILTTDPGSNFKRLSFFIIWASICQKIFYCVRRRRTHPNLAVGSGWMPDWFEGFSSGRPSCCLDFMRDREWHGNKVVLQLCYDLWLRVSFDVVDTSYIEFSFFQHVELRTTDNQIGQPIATAPSLSIVVYANP